VSFTGIGNGKATSDFRREKQEAYYSAASKIFTDGSASCWSSNIPRLAMARRTSGS